MRNDPQNRGWLRYLLPGLLLTAGCEGDPGAEAAAATEYPPVVRIVEVLAAPAGAQAPFVELRNDSELATKISGLSLNINGKKLGLKQRVIKGSVPSPEGPGTIAAHGLALIIDKSVPAERAAELACEAPVRTTASALHRDPADILASTIELQARRHCVPVFEVKALAAALAAAQSVALVGSSGEMDRAEASFGSAPRGVSFERRGIDNRAFEQSPLGATPGARNFYRGDQGLLHEANSPRPLAAMSSSPWRVGDAILALEMDAVEAEAAGDAARAQELRTQAAAMRAGKLPHNPLVEPFDSLLLSAKSRVSGSFYQINDALVIDTLVSAKQRGADVRLTTDASFFSDPHYAEGFARLKEAGVPLVFDFNANQVDRPSLSHNKFLTVDGQWVWAGSFNPIEDEPSRIHADNVLIMRSPMAAALHDQEFETLFGGKFSVDKRDTGTAGGRFAVDGAEVSLRFSPGISTAVLKKRGAAFAGSKDVAKACNVTAAGKPLIPERYRGLDPCGGPYDLIMGELARATSSIYYVSFSLSLDDMEAVMHERLDAGVEIKGIVDPTVYSRGIIQNLTAKGADLRAAPNSDPDCPAYVTPKKNCPANPNKVWLHHKFIVIDYGTDHPVVITGSHNLSASAEEKNDEALLVIRDRAVAESYYRMFHDAYEHPQTTGDHRLTTGLPGLAITEVLASTDPAATQLVEITNVGGEPASLVGLELWNRRSEPWTLGDVSLGAGQRMVAVVNNSGLVAAGVTSVTLTADNARPLVDPATALVLRNATDGRWVATYDPYTAQQNLPEGVMPKLGASYHWADISTGRLEGFTDALLGVNTTPEAEIPTWSPRGFYSDWPNEHHVTPTSLVLMLSTRDKWIVSAPTPGS